VRLREPSLSPGLPNDISYKFVNYGERLAPAPGVLVLDVGLSTVPGVIDHHHRDAEPECAASLLVKHPGLVLDHVRPEEPLTIVTHRLPDFDALAAIFLALKLLESGGVDAAMAKIGAYAKMVDSASLPRTTDLGGTPYAVLRSLFAGSKKPEDEINRDRIEEGAKFFRFLYAKAAGGQEIVADPKLFAGIDRYERAMDKIRADVHQYLDDLARGRTFRLRLPKTSGDGRIEVDGLAVVNPRSFLLKEWARRDAENPTLGRGYSFLMASFGPARAILGVDPERGIHLRGLGPALNEREAKKRAAAGRPFPFSWYEGDCPFFDYRIIDSPQDGTALSPDEVLDAVLAFGV
jgi:hypothetical protein